MAPGPSVLLLDDGELDDIQALVEEFGVPFARVRGGAIVHGTQPPRDLLVATPRRVEAVRVVAPLSIGRQPVRLVVVSEDSNALRRQLRDSGFDYLIRRPVHPEALRLLVLRCLYRGEERRREPRVAVGFEVGFRTGLKTRRAVMADISVRGCRLVAASSIDAGRRIRVNVPDGLGTGDPVAVTGRVLRVDRPSDKERSHLYSAAVLFDELSESSRKAVELLIEDLALGPATLPEDQQAPPTAAQPGATASARPRGRGRASASPPPLEKMLRPEADDRAAGEDASPQDQPIEVDLSGESGERSPRAGRSGKRAREDRRARRRVAYAHTVPAFSKRALRVLVGRDLSVGGMRIDPLPGLELGDRLHLAIYGDAGASPFLVWATVTRDDGPAGMALSFDPLEPDLGDRLERLVGSLPAVESLHDSEAQAMGTVMSEILAE